MVTIETVKFIQAIFIAHDKKMYVAKSDTMVQVQSSNLNEELGQVSYVFSDKTGTLTCNEMIFKKLIVHGTPYGLEQDPTCIKSMPKVTNVDFSDPKFFKDLANPKKVQYLKFLAICHGILTEEKDLGNGQVDIQFNSSSPDEIALANFAKMCGYEFRGVNTDNEILLRVTDLSKDDRYVDSKIKILYNLDFTSKRKRQSIITEEKDGIWLYTKGADNVILERTKPAQREE
jgi:phospholipid-transporting ATPase